ncbi:MAG: hypothetical protein D6775_04725 [Caldilineae bacterium]|nr:MAG: hypothetical protein D6775_04725 [Caldilineae bacterium]
MKLSLFLNAEEEQATIPYILAVSLVDEVILPHNRFLVPVYRESDSDNASLLAIEICGMRLEAREAEALLPPAARLLDGLINMARLPTYVFIAAPSRQIFPVYTVGDEVFATTPGGPVFRHVELANVRQYLGDYLHGVAVLGSGQREEKLHVRGVDTNTLGLIRPSFYLKKRVPGEDEFWAPVFLSLDGREFYTYAASARRAAPVDNGHGVLALHELVAQALIDDGRLHDPLDLRPDRLFPDMAGRVLEELVPQPYRLTFRTLPEQALETLAVYKNGKMYATLEHRRSEDRYNLYFGADPADLRERMAFDLVRRGKISDPAAVELVV